MGLSADWQTKKLGEICKTSSGGTPSRKNKSYYGGEIPWVKSGELNFNTIRNAKEKITEEAISESSAKMFPEGTLLIALYGATVGKLAFLGLDAATNQAVCAIMPKNGLDNKYLYWYLFFIKKDLVGKSIGGAQPNISQTILKNVDIPVPPLPTQHRIVEKIEELFSELDNGVGNLKKARQQLKTYRQAVLKDAFEGKLTKEWREQQEHLPTPEELLKQIKAESKAHHQRELAEWEKEVKQWKKDGKPGRKPRKPRKAKELPEITEDDLKSLPEIPASWRYSYLNDLGDLGRGKSKHRPRNDEKLFENGTIPFIQTGEVKAANKYLKTFEETYNEFGLNQSKLWPKGTLCITIAANIAETAILDIDACFPDSIVGYTSYESLADKLFVFYFIQSVQKRLEAFAPATAQKNINLTTLENLLVPLCSLREQKEIVNEIESRLSVVDQLEQTIKENLQKAEALRQSILKKAFGGELVL